MRKSVYPEYKKKEPKDSVEYMEKRLNEMREQGLIETKDYAKQYEEWCFNQTIQNAFQFIPKILSLMGFKVIKIAGEEADDVIKLTADRLTQLGHKVMIASEDKDYLQLISPNISIYKPRQGTEWFKDDFIATYGFEPCYFPIYRAFLGDNSDKILGVKGIGEKRAVEIMKSIDWSPDDDIDDIRNKLFEYVKTKASKSIGKIITDGMDILCRNIQLIDLQYIALRESSIQPLEQALEGIDAVSPDRNKVVISQLIDCFKMFELKNQMKWAGHLNTGKN
jgi:5'-3' exonuclease